jgi:cell division protein FtsI/penicillin-binding protein 2
MRPLLVLLSFLRIDVETGQIVQKQWSEGRPVEVGSLAKPFVALAYAQSHDFRYPRVTCKHCWLPRGHGEVGIVEAIAQSCNTYFDTLRRQLKPGELDAVANRFGLPDADQATPEQVLRAYIELWKRSREPGVAQILEGMREAARVGTAKGVHRDALAKTGTGPCTHNPKAPGDGFAVVLYPAAQPRIALLVNLHSRPGAHAAIEAGRLLGK